MDYMKKVKDKLTSAKEKFPAFNKIKPLQIAQLQKYYSHIFHLFILSTVLSFVVLLGALFFLSELHKKYVEDSRRVVREYYYWKQVAKTHPNFPDGLIQAARYSYYLGNDTEALDYVQNALRYDPKSQKALELRNKISENNE